MRHGEFHCLCVKPADAAEAKSNDKKQATQLKIIRTFWVPGKPIASA